MNLAVQITILCVSLLTVLLITLLLTSIKVVSESKVYVIERNGKYYKTWSNGIHFKLPLIDQIVNIVSLKEQMINFKPLDLVTKDNNKIEIETIFFFQVVDAFKYTYEIAEPTYALESLIKANLSTLIGELSSKDVISAKALCINQLENILTEDTKTWGIKIIKVQIKSIKQLL